MELLQNSGCHCNKFSMLQITAAINYRFFPSHLIHEHCLPPIPYFCAIAIRVKQETVKHCCILGKPATKITI